MRTKLTPLQRRLRKCYTAIGRVSRKPRSGIVWLRVGNQAFTIHQELTVNECEFYQDMLAIALSAIVLDIASSVPQPSKGTK